ncbi:ArsR/SmtB family transcription factor [Brevibacterium casei]|uniref:ArsR/SmtB family transcription factor n=1 Tax=Brevibacterium casei TaxID=33889 RepID=UPI0011A8AEA7|nr:metalloregulator ArsR/SmtB family transcription factor [Brevibacterium casei]
MVNHSEELDEVFTALADPTRRAVVARLGHGPASISELAEPLSMSMPSFLKHVRTLESCGLITTRKTGRVRTCVLNKKRLTLVDRWLETQRRSWEAATDRLDAFVTGASTPDSSARTASSDHPASTADRSSATTPPTAHPHPKETP